MVHVSEGPPSQFPVLPPVVLEEFPEGHGEEEYCHNLEFTVHAWVGEVLTRQRAVQDARN